MNFKPIILEGFNGREKSLENIIRYKSKLFPVMIYRTNNLIHSRRVLYHLEKAIPDILEVYSKNLDIDFSRTLCLVHDDIEIITGDIVLHDKENMNKQQTKQLSLEEKKAIPKIIKMYSKNANGFDYQELLNTAKYKDKLEAQFVSYFDKFDAAGEAWHEIFAGNYYFVLPAGGHNGRNGGYVRRLKEFPIKYPLMRDFFKRFPEYLPYQFNFKNKSKKGKPHTIDSLNNPSGYFPYDKWKKTIMEREGTDLLISPIEKL